MNYTQHPQESGIELIRIIPVSVQRSKPNSGLQQFPESGHARAVSVSPAVPGPVSVSTDTRPFHAVLGMAVAQPAAGPEKPTSCRPPERHPTEVSSLKQRTVIKDSKIRILRLASSLSSPLLLPAMSLAFAILH